MEGRVLQLRGGKSEVQVPDEQVYFTFGDGRLAYDCISCGAQCCRGHGYLLGSELALETQLARPSVRFFLDSKEKGRNHVNTCPPQCFFLNDELRCDIHVRQGPSAKPETCRLFPFNNFFLLDSGHLVVAPHPGLCPLEVVETPARAAASEYAELLSAMNEHGITTPVERRTGLLRDSALQISLEREITSLSETWLASGGAFTELISEQKIQTAACLAEVQQPGAGAVGTSLSVDDLVDHLSRALGVSDAESVLGDGTVSRTVAAVAPSLRARLGFLTGDAGGAAARAPLTDIRLIPNAILATCVLAQLAKSAGMTSVTFQTVSRLFEGERPLITLLAHLDEVVEWRRGAPISLAGGHERHEFNAGYLKVANATLRSRREPGRTLYQIVEEHNNWEGLDRMLFLRFLARRLYGKIGPPRDGAHRPERTEAVRPKRALKRLLVKSFPAELLAAVGLRRSGGSRE